MRTTDLKEPELGRLSLPDDPSGAPLQEVRQVPVRAPATGLRPELAAQVLAVLALLAVLHLHLLSALLAGLLIYELVHVVAPRSRGIRKASRTGKMIALTLLASFIILAVFFGVLGLMSLLSRGPESVTALMQKMADVIETARSRLPVWALTYLPEDSDELRDTATEWLRAHADQLRVIGQDVWRVLVHILVGLVIGGMVAVSSETQPRDRRPLAQALTDRARLLGEAFRGVVFAQVRIAAINSVLTGLYLLVALPMLGIKLPLAKTMVAVTFLTGLLPVIGNLISNTVIVVVSLSVSITVAISSLLFLIVIHKLEYFVNARIMGAQLHARAWELLLAMIAMEAAFGIPGVIAAPIYYAYVKKELSAQGLG